MEEKNEVNRKQTRATQRHPLASITPLSVTNWTLGLTSGRDWTRADPTAPAPRADTGRAGGYERLDVAGRSQQGAAAGDPKGQRAPQGHAW